MQSLGLEEPADYFRVSGFLGCFSVCMNDATIKAAAAASLPAVHCASIRQLQAECQFALSAVICAEQSSRRILILLIVQLTVIWSYSKGLSFEGSVVFPAKTIMLENMIE